MLTKCLWNDPVALRAAAPALAAEGFDQAAQGCLERADKVEYLFTKFGNPPRNTRPFLEPVDLR